MLELRNIVKDYVTGPIVTHALKGVTINFRKSEFVSVLGPSGCGKTTLLNIIGGLDHYTSGDLLIEGKSTKEYKDRDWDTYRNHSIGFIFQSYNLISHQSIVSNVELALTISGVKKKERRERAIAALKKVGLEEYINKMPNQLSGGQAQRVAIARALVNDPEILLADEPTGALDSDTSVQIMDLLKEIAKDRLVIMVTHNPDLANEYSTRIIKLNDGLVTDDSNPCTPEELALEETERVAKFKGNKKQASMSFWTALSLSFKNLLSKKGRTILVAFAGSIGITGIALILSLSDGFHSYVNQIQEDTLSSYPITITQTETELSLETLLNREDDGLQEYPEGEDVNESQLFINILSTYTSSTYENDLASFKTYLDDPETKAEYSQYYNAIQYVYSNIDIEFYQKKESKYKQIYPTDKSALPAAFRTIADFINPVDELIDNQELLEEQYDLLKGSYPKDPTDLVIVVDKYNRIDDYILYTLGVKDLAEDLAIVAAGEKPAKWKGNFDEILSLEYKLVTRAEQWIDNGDGTYGQMDSNQFAEYCENAPVAHIRGILRPKKASTIQSFNGTIGYTKEFTKNRIETINNAAYIKAQKANPTKNLLNGDDLSEEGYNDIMTYFRVYDESKPSRIKIYPKSFADKEKIKEMVNKYNDTKQTEVEKIRYQDSVGTIISAVDTIVNSVTYVLIAFVSISLVVSSIMIGIITYVSVIERTKEIGTLRSLGSSKLDIANVFNAETLMIGVTSGILGCLLAMLLDIPVNLILASLTGISNLAFLMWYWVFALVGISMVLTFIAGLVPSQIASRKDPVVALRTGE